MSDKKLREMLQAAYDFYMSPQACGDFTCACNNPEVCGICEIRATTESVLGITRPAKSAEKRGLR